MLGLCIFIGLAITSRAEMEGYIVGGSFAMINRYPHSAFLRVSCLTVENFIYNWICGASIVNQQILLTAGHCVSSCIPGTRILANMGNENREKGITRSASSYVIHEKYDPPSNTCDIAIVKLSKPVEFTSMVRRVAIMKSPPYQEPANLAGWGDTDEKTGEQSYNLLEIDQKVWNHKNCERLFFSMPRGTICANSKIQTSYAAAGDSGAALVVRDYIQIGLVSYKVPQLAVNVIVFTDVGYHYEWIKFNAHRLYCSSGTLV